MAVIHPTTRAQQPSVSASAQSIFNSMINDSTDGKLIAISQGNAKKVLCFKSFQKSVPSNERKKDKNKIPLGSSRGTSDALVTDWQVATSRSTVGRLGPVQVMIFVTRFRRSAAM